MYIRVCVYLTHLFDNIHTTCRLPLFVVCIFTYQNINLYLYTSRKLKTLEIQVAVYEQTISFSFKNQQKI